MLMAILRVVVPSPLMVPWPGTAAAAAANLHLPSPPPPPQPQVWHGCASTTTMLFDMLHLTRDQER
jgi:hypothetical protein